jgi:hypothetical protein
MMMMMVGNCHVGEEDEEQQLVKVTLGVKDSSIKSPNTKPVI